MKKIKALLLSLLLLSATAQANATKSVDCEDCGNNVGDIASLEAPSNLDKVVRSIASKIDLDNDLVEMVCGSTNDQDYETVIEALSAYELKLEDVYNDIDCGVAKLPGPTLMHLVLRTGTRTLSIGEDILITIEKAKKKNPKLITSVFFNMAIQYFGEKRTVLDILNFERNGRKDPQTGKLPASVEERYSKVENLLVKLGAKTSIQIAAEQDDNDDLQLASIKKK